MSEVMTAAKVAKIVNLKSLYCRFTEAQNYKDRWLALYKNLYYYVIPDRDAFNVKFNYQDVGKPLTIQIYDPTAMLAAYQRANDLHGLLLPQDRVWGKLSLDPHLYSKELINNAQITMDEINDRIFYFINQSNLSRVVASSNLDLVGGTAAIWVESISDEVPLYFRSIPAVALFLEYSTDDVLNTCWFAQKMTGRTIVDMFPDYTGTMRQQVTEHPEEIYLVYYGQIKITEDKFYIYAVLEGDPDHVLFEHYKPYNQIIVYRDRVRPGEAEGRGIATDMLPLIQSLNRIVMYDEQSMAFKANPPMFYDSGNYFNPYSVRQWAGAMIARNPGGRNPLEALQMPTSPEVLEKITRMQNQIIKGFQVDPLGEVDSPTKSATEMSIRENRAQRTSSTDISRLINEQPKQVYQVSAKILNERSLLLQSRQQIPGFDTRKLKFEYQSPLYDLQNQEDIGNFIQSKQIMQQFYGEGAAIATSNIFEVNSYINQKLKVPKKLSATDEQIQAFLNGLAQQAAQSAQPQPSTSGTPVALPQSPGVTI